MSTAAPSTPNTQRRPKGSRPAPSHSSSSSSGSLNVAQTISGVRSAVSYSEYGGYYEPEPSSGAEDSYIAQELLQPLANVSLNQPAPPTSRSTTPKPKLASLKTGGGVAASIGAPDPEIFDAADAPAAPRPLRPSAPLLNLGIPRRPSQSETMAESPRPTLRPPPIGGGGKKRGPLLAIPMGTVPMGAIGADEPDAVSLIGPTDDLNSTTQSNGAQPQTPLNPAGDEGDLTVRPALPQGHSQAKSIEKIKAVISPSSSTASTDSGPAEDDWAEADEFLKDVSRLGEGAGGEVWKVEDTRTGTKLARKIIQARTTPPKQLVRELKYLKDTGHVNIVRFYGAYITPSSSEVKVLMEFCEGGSLEAIGDKIKAGNGRVSEPVAAKIGEGVSLLPFTSLFSTLFSFVTTYAVLPFIPFAGTVNSNWMIRRSSTDSITYTPNVSSTVTSNRPMSSCQNTVPSNCVTLVSLEN